MSHVRSVRWLLGILIFVFLCTQAMAEIVFTADGRVILGTLESAANGEVKYSSMGSKVTLKAQDIIRTESTVDAIKDLVLEVRLKDGSLFKGKLTEFDADIGLFVDIDFGILTIPTASIEGIYQSAQRRKYDGAATSAHATFVLMQPLNPNNGFGLTLGPRLGLEYQIPGARGLYAGLSTGLLFMDYQTSPLVEYSTFDLGATITYKLLVLHTEQSILSWFAPFVSIGAGAVSILSADNRVTGQAVNYGTITGMAQASLGLDIEPVSFLSFRLSGTIQSIFEAQGPFWQLGGQFSVGVQF